MGEIVRPELLSELEVTLIEGLVLEKVEDTFHRDHLRETHGANVVVVVRFSGSVGERVGTESAPNALTGLDDLERDAEIEQDEGGIQASGP